MYYYGPYSTKCQIAIWVQAGCVEEGWNFPTYLSFQQNVSINSKNLLYADILNLNWFALSKVIALELLRQKSALRLGNWVLFLVE